jgi:hypothetical protein
MGFAFAKTLVEADAEGPILPESALLAGALARAPRFEPLLRLVILATHCHSAVVSSGSVGCREARAPSGSGVGSCSSPSEVPEAVFYGET